MTMYIRRVTREQIIDPERNNGEPFYRVVIRDISGDKPLIVAVAESQCERQAMRHACRSVGISWIKKRKDTLYDTGAVRIL